MQAQQFGGNAPETHLALQPLRQELQMASSDCCSIRHRPFFSFDGNIGENFSNYLDSSALKKIRDPVR